MIAINCPYCNKHVSTLLSERDKEVVVECCCGMIYKAIIDPDKEVKHYKKPSIWDKHGFDRRYDRVVNYLRHELPIKPKKILDIGAGAGGMAWRLSKVFPGASIICVEQSAPLAFHINEKCPMVAVVNKSFEAKDLSFGEHGLVLCMGVDYLFMDHPKAMQKIRSIIGGFGFLYIERNIYADMKSFMGKKVKNREQLFWTNKLINNWFTKEQFQEVLERYFTIRDKVKYEEGGSTHIGFLCVSKDNTDR